MEESIRHHGRSPATRTPWWLAAPATSAAIGRGGEQVPRRGEEKAPWERWEKKDEGVCVTDVKCG